MPTRSDAFNRVRGALKDNRARDRVLGLEPDEQLLKERVVVLGKERLKLLLSLCKGGRKGRCRQPLAPPLRTERLAFEIPVARRPFAR